MNISINNSLCMRLRQEDGNHRYLIMAQVYSIDAEGKPLVSVWHNVTANNEKGELFCYKGQIQSRAYAFAKYLSTQGDVYEGYSVIHKSKRTYAKKFDCLEFIASKLMECVSQTEDYEVYCRLGYPLSSITGLLRERLLTSDDLEMFEVKCKQNPDDAKLIFTRKDIKRPDDMRATIVKRYFEKADHYFVIDMTPENELQDKQFMTNKKAFISKAIGTKHHCRALQFKSFDMAFDFAQNHMLDFPTQGFDVVQIDKETILEVFSALSYTNFWEQHWK